MAEAVREKPRKTKVKTKPKIKHVPELPTVSSSPVAPSVTEDTGNIKTSQITETDEGDRTVSSSPVTPSVTEETGNIKTSQITAKVEEDRTVETVESNIQDQPQEVEQGDDSKEEGAGLDTGQQIQDDGNKLVTSDNREGNIFDVEKMSVIHTLETDIETNENTENIPLINDEIQSNIVTDIKTCDQGNTNKTLETAENANIENTSGLLSSLAAAGDKIKTSEFGEVSSETVTAFPDLSSSNTPVQPELNIYPDVSQLGIVDYTVEDILRVTEQENTLLDETQELSETIASNDFRVNLEIEANTNVERLYENTTDKTEVVVSENESVTMTSEVLVSENEAVTVTTDSLVAEDNAVTLTTEEQSQSAVQPDMAPAMEPENLAEKNRELESSKNNPGNIVASAKPNYLTQVSVDSNVSAQYEILTETDFEGASTEEGQATAPKEIVREECPTEEEEYVFPTSAEEEARLKSVREAMEARRIHFIHEVGSCFKPMTFEQLQQLYYNPQLVQSTAFIDQFVMNEGKKESHPFHEILLNYFRARKNLLSAEENVKLLQNEYSQLQEDMWILTSHTVIAQGMCGDKAKVSTVHSYQQGELSKEALNNMSTTLQTIRDEIIEKISLYAYSAQLSRLQVESYLYNLFLTCPALRDIPKNAPVQAHARHKLQLVHQINRLKDCISVLFAFHRRPCRDQEFTKNTRKWTDILVGVLLRVATFEDHCFILNHILRCPGGTGQWASKLIQIPVPTSVNDGMFGGPVLDHVVVCLATVLLPPKGREEFMCHMKISQSPESLNQDATWILVDSDGEEDEDPVNAWLYLHENDIVAILKQFPISAVFSHILMVKTDHVGSVFYDISRTNESVMLKIFAFCTCWIDLLGRGLQTYSMARYRQLNKRIGRMIRETVEIVSNHWENYKTSLLQPRSVTDGLQAEFDQFFMRATYCILTAQKLGSWQFMANMPFTCVSSNSMWQLLWILHQGQGQELDLDKMPTVEKCKEYLKDPNSRNQLVDNLLTLQSSETIYLLTTFANMAESRPTTEVDFIESITLEVFQIAYVCDHTREFCSKVGRELLSGILEKHPYTFSVLLQSVRKNMKQIGSMALYLFRELPLHQSRPTDPDMLVIRQWLLQCELNSHENQLARHILSNLNWDVSPQHGMILPLRIHRQVSLLIVEAYRKYISNRNYSLLIAEGIRQVASVVRQNVTIEQQLSNWTWDLALRLKLHFHSITVDNHGLASDFQPCHLDEDDWLLPIVKGIKEKNPLSCYVGLLMSSKTHSAREFVEKGLDILGCLVTANQFTAVIHILNCVCPYFLSSPAYLTDNERFIKILQSTIWADETLYKMAKSVITSDFPGNITTQFIAMIQNDVSKKRELFQSQLVILFWVRGVTRINKWYQDRNCCYILNKLIEVAFTREGLLPQVEAIFKDCFMNLIKESGQQGVMSSVVNWISSGVYLPSFLERSSSREFVWLSYIILMLEKNYEVGSRIWPSLQEELYGNQAVTVDQALKNVIHSLKLQHAPALHRLNIYRWALQAMDTPYDHTLLPLLWQQFFLLFLGRNVTETSVPHRASIGERFFSSLGHSSMLKMMKKNLSETIEKLHKDIEEATEEQTENQTLNRTLDQNNIQLKQRLLRLYQTMVLWLEEPRLHDANLYLPSLPPQYDASKLLLLFQNIQNPWMEFVDLKQVCEDVESSGVDWRKLITCRPSRSPTINQNQWHTATEKIVDCLKRDSLLLAAPGLVTLKPAVPDISVVIIEDKSSLLHLINADINIIKQYAGLFTDRIDRHCAADMGYVDLLPSLYSNQWKQVMLPVECTSKVNPLHRCSNPAVVNLRIEEREKNDIIQRQIDENRAEYKQIMIEGLLPPPQNVCIAAVHVENAITALIKLAQATTTDEKVTSLFDTANTLFYQLAACITEETEFYPPSKQFFQSCIEIIGQEFISRDPRQTQNLLQFSLDNPKRSGLTSPHFNPNNSAPIFVGLYEQLISVLKKQNLDLVFMLLTKFDVWLWLEKGRPSTDEIKKFISILGSALMTCGAEPEKQTKIVFDLYCSHLQLVLQHNYPCHMTDVLSVLLQGSSLDKIHVHCWEMFLMACFTYIPTSTVEGGRKPSLVFNIEQVESCRDTQLSTIQVNEILNWLSSYFMGVRSKTNTGALYGLYPTWGRYIPYISQLLATLIRCLVTKMMFNLTDIDPYQVLDVVWRQTTTVFAPWIEPVWHNNQLISPWHEGDDLVAMEMVAMFRKMVTFLYNEFEEKAPNFSSSVYSLLLMYFMTSLAKQGVLKHVVSTIITELEQLPWKTIKPDIQLLETMIKVKEVSPEPCFHLVGYILTQADWNVIWDYHNIHQPPDIASRFQSTLLVLMIQTYGTASLLQKPETVQLLSEMECREWNFITLSSYRNASNAFLMTAEPKCVLAERSNPSSRGLALMKKAGCFTVESSGSWSGDLQAKRQMYIHTVTSLLCQCTYLEDINPDTFSTVIVNLLSDIEHVESSVVDWRNQDIEAVELVRVFLSLLNNGNPQGPWKDLIIATIIQWIESSPQSLLLLPFIKASSRHLASHSHIAQITETCIDVLFQCDGNKQEWTPILAAFQMPETNHAGFIKDAINQGAYLVLQTYLLQQIPFCQSLADEFRLMEMTIDWTERVKPGCENESKLLIWWWKLLQLMRYYIERDGSKQECVKLLYRLIAALQILGEDRTSSGLLGAIGFGRKSQLSLRFRITVRVLAAFLASQIISVTTIRMTASQKPSTTPAAKQTMLALQTLKTNREYTDYKDQCNMLCVFIDDERMCFGHAVLLLSQLVKAFYSDKLYLNVVSADES
ncbi:hypothetical protein SNE40_015786 [Patella caerulea]|uniref:Ectopic P granules protein 5 homolog n=1 Tax=Patella caerulea TaxID=87958 RepID=A0AAN8JPV5_PATCE